MTNTRITRRQSLGVGAAALASILGASRALGQEASPAASPEPGMQLPEGPLGMHAQWLLDSVNAGPGTITTEQIHEHFTLAFLEKTPISKVFKSIAALQIDGVTYTIEENSFITTMDMPATNGRFVLVGSDGSRNQVSMVIDRDSKLINEFSIAPAGENATPEASPDS